MRRNYTSCAIRQEQERQASQKAWPQGKKLDDVWVTALDYAVAAMITIKFSSPQAALIVSDL